MNKDEKIKLYLDTSIPSAYYDTSKPMRQLITQKWFENKAPLYQSSQTDKAIALSNQKVTIAVRDPFSYPAKVYLSNSPIHGKGVFAATDIYQGEVIGLLHKRDKENGYEFTLLGEMHNHSYEPTCENIMINNQRFLKSIKMIRKGTELTTDYRLQPDLEQPMEDWR